MVNSLIHIPHVVALIDLQCEGLYGFTTLYMPYTDGASGQFASEQATEKPETMPGVRRKSWSTIRLTNWKVGSLWPTDGVF